MFLKFNEKTTARLQQLRLEQNVLAQRVNDIIIATIEANGHKITDRTMIDMPEDRSGVEITEVKETPEENEAEQA